MRTAIRQSPQGRRGDYATESPFLANPPLADVGSMNPPHALAKSAPMILTEKFLLPPNIDDAQRQAIVHQRMRKCRGINGRVIAVFPGEDGLVRQLGNTDETTYFGVIEHRFSPSQRRR